MQSAGHDFYDSPRPVPQDQADGLRRLFGGRRRHVLPLVANPHVAFSGLVLDRLAAVFAANGREVLVVDAGALSPPPHELATVELSACVERLSPRVSYLPARGLPTLHVDTRGAAGGFIEAVLQAAPQAEIVLLHAEGQDLARIFKGRAARPLLIGADHPESIKHAYANLKLLARRCDLLTFDLLLAASTLSPRAAAIGASLADCADRFAGAMLLHTALIDPADDPGLAPDAALSALLAAQLSLDDSPPLPAAPPAYMLPRAATQFSNRPAHP
ncbi:Flagellar biosynthesis protein [Rubrivivax sp. A210]|uniref:flagellar biosynthesis protein n=1 Tax=Rubrivivax sp. A210 TaxID=2772301 RepID=UPI001919F819|nr:flagellar biosynthesis protein [Rubrivivax sp. A210]CAD5374755.1 Flagellar biosynthesis protein [Rubrivivax sp. A210]